MMQGSCPESCQFNEKIRDNSEGIIKFHYSSEEDCCQIVAKYNLDGLQLLIRDINNLQIGNVVKLH